MLQLETITYLWDTSLDQEVVVVKLQIIMVYTLIQWELIEGQNLSFMVIKVEQHQH